MYQKKIHRQIDRQIDRQIHIIAGANGAGKTTKADFLLPSAFLD